jgi:hypothetical protein
MFIHRIILCLVSTFVALEASDELVFDLRPETVIFNAVSYHLEDGKSPELIEKTIVGKFYQAKFPVIRGSHSESSVSMTPFSVLEEMLFYIQSEQYDKLPELYSPQTRDQVVSRLNDAAIRPMLVKWLSSVDELKVLGYWLEAPNLLIAYVQVNENGIRPYVFEFSDGWFLRAGHFDSKFSNYLDGFYTKYNNENMEIVSPPSIAAMSQIFANAELVSFTSSLGLVLK